MEPRRAPNAGDVRRAAAPRSSRALTADFGGRRGQPARRARHGARRRRPAAASATRRPRSSSTGSPPASFPAIGDLRRARPPPPARSRCRRGAPIWYSGSPIQVDFGEAGAGKHVLRRRRRARRRPACGRAGRAHAPASSCARVTGTLAELAAIARPRPRRRLAAGRVDRAGPRRARRRRPRAARRPRRRGAHRRRRRAADAPAAAARPGRSAARAVRTSTSAEQDIDDAALAALFAELLDDELGAVRPLRLEVAGLRRLPRRTTDGRLRRRRPVRARRPDRLGQVHGHRRDLLRALRQRAPLRRQARRRRSCTMGAIEAARRASPSSVGRPALRRGPGGAARRKTGGATTKEARLERGRTARCSPARRARWTARSRSCSG